MSDAIQHECGLAFIRLRKPFSHYQQKYGTALFGLNKLYLLMEKQHNRGQDGAGIAAVSWIQNLVIRFYSGKEVLQHRQLRIFSRESERRSWNWKNTNLKFASIRV
jgi:hypothetical protein